MTWTTERFESVAQRSQRLHGNRHTLPVAAAIAELDRTVVKSSEVAVQLGGHLAPNRVLEGLERLCELGALEQLPYQGRPHPRMFERSRSAYWMLIAELAEDTNRSAADR